MPKYSLQSYQTRETVTEPVIFVDEKLALKYFGNKLKRTLAFDEPEDHPDPAFMLLEVPILDNAIRGNKEYHVYETG